MRRIDADRLAAHLADWQRRLEEHGECGGCAAELIGQVARVVDGWPEADGNPSGHMREDSGEAAIPQPPSATAPAGGGTSAPTSPRNLKRSGNMPGVAATRTIPPALTRHRPRSLPCPALATNDPPGHLLNASRPLHKEAGGCERMRTDTQPPRREDADAQGCVLAWDAHGSGWVVRQYKNLQGARWWMPLPGAPE